MKPDILIITGYGLNCEVESTHAWEKAGARVRCIHLNDLLADPDPLMRVQGVMFIGGFSFGDHMTSGHVFAHRIRHHLGQRMADFVAGGGLVLGVCNGFQIMTKMGLLPGLNGALTQEVALTQNDCASFQNRWVRIGFHSASSCIFTRGLDAMDLPIRHGEGKLHVPTRALLDRMEGAGCVACRYLDPATGEPTQTFPHNPNGSIAAIAGLCDSSGRCFGLMPHPEAFLFPENHPQWDRPGVRERLGRDGSGLALFANAVSFLNAQ